MESTLQFRRQPVPRAALAAPRTSPLPVYFAAILGYLLLLPPQLNVTIAESVIPPYRFFLIGASLYVLGTTARGRLRPSLPDFCILLSIVWICIAMSITSTTKVAVTASVAHTADIGLAYFFARMAFRDLQDFRRFLILILPGVLITAIIVMIEAVTFTHLIQPFFSKLTGKPFVYLSSPRMGLMRAQGPFAHPISAGIFLGSFLSLYWLSGFKGWVRAVGAIAAFGSFFSVSSAAFLSLFGAGALLVYNWLTQQIANLSWRAFFLVAAIFVFVGELGTKAGTFGLLVRFTSLDTNTGYQRINIWNYGTQNVRRHPWFGLGYGDWDRPAWMTSSVDNYWLLTAMRFGILPSVLLSFATVMAILLLMKKSMSSTGADQQTERGVAIAMAIFGLGLVSVAVWLSVQVWYYMLLGITVSLAMALVPQMQRRPQFVVPPVPVRPALQRR
ncbi:O-antigen ligase family protein [Erythrobacter colymbi]|uniref:O-antigen ligase family protein n=1 Tax=Erythrobacter colymbi TaxID=1161202 RepID=UPI000A38EE23|nr:O-antigen ligase family protein [Erythrobacter colymbi]